MLTNVSVKATVWQTVLGRQTMANYNRLAA